MYQCLEVMSVSGILSVCLSSVYNLHSLYLIAAFRRGTNKIFCDVMQL